MSTDSFTSQLEADNARINGEHCHFPGSPTHRAIGEQTLVIPLSQYGFMRADGPDGEKFFQGQTTADFRQVSTNQARDGAYCNPKGRMLASFTAARLTEQTLILKLRRDCVTDGLSVLSKYAVFSKVELADASGDYVAIGVVGAQAKACLRQAFPSLAESFLSDSASNDTSLATCIDEQTVILQRAGDRFELWLPATLAAQVWPVLRQHAHVAGSQVWDALDIEAGTVAVCAATREEFLPQLLNYDLTGAVSFKKGCYTGQEVVARLHFKGVPKRRLYRACIDGEVNAGDEVLDGDKPVGTVACCTDDGTAAVVLATGSAASTGLHLKNGATVSEVTPPPYGLGEND